MTKWSATARAALFAAMMFCVLPATAVHALEHGDETDGKSDGKDEKAAKPANKGDDSTTVVERGADGLPRFKHPYTDGLYSTVVAMNMFYVPVPEKQKKQKLKVPNFKKEVPIYTITQDFAAPLVVVLMGVDGKVEGPWGTLFPYWYSEAGYHVLAFDSTFTPQYAVLSGQGVVGNFDAETDQVASIIDAYLKTDVKAKVTKVGVVGMSFGATQALLLAAKAKEGKLPFQLAGCLALSPPANLQTSAQTVDRFFREDRWDTTMVDLAKKFMAHLPVAEGQPIPFQPTELRAAIGFAFRDGLTDVVERNDRMYNLRLLPSTNPDTEEDRGSYAAATGLEKFISEFTFKYWQKKGTIKSPDELWDVANLSKILPRLPEFAEAVVAENDPFNSPEDLAAAKAADVNHRLTVVPVGGHLGFISADWTLVKALRIFGRKFEPVPMDSRATDQARKEAAAAVDAATQQSSDDKKDKKKDKKKKSD
jgi:predicted alpha/beta-fold hydrolase